MSQKSKWIPSVTPPAFVCPSHASQVTTSLIKHNLMLGFFKGTQLYVVILQIAFSPWNIVAPITLKRLFLNLIFPFKVIAFPILKDSHLLYCLRFRLFTTHEHTSFCWVLLARKTFVIPVLFGGILLTNSRRWIEIGLPCVNSPPAAIFMRLTLSLHDDAGFLHKLLSSLSPTLAAILSKC